MQIEISMAVENVSEHKYQRDSPTTHPFQMNDAQRQAWTKGCFSI